VRKLGFFLLVACAIIGAVWYVQKGGFRDDEQEIAEDELPLDHKADAGAPRRRTKKKATHRKAKASDSRQAHASAAIPPGGHAPAGPSGTSYETAIAGSNLKLAPGMDEAPDLTDAELAGPMRDGTFLDACGVPSSTRVTVKVAIRNGHAVGVSVYPTPPNAYIAGCVQRQVRGFQWPSNAKMDSFVTSY
jgi:eukaryotic-like serine/threonine-protein kinase